MTRRVLALLGLLVLLAPAARAADWFERFKDEADGHALHRFLHAMPKGGDLHNHLAGAGHPEWFLEAALDARAQGWRYYTKTEIRNCRYGSDEFGPAPYLLLFRTIPEYAWRALPDCERGEYRPLDALDAAQRAAWLSSLRLDAAHEGRAEFFEAHWDRLGGLLTNPQLVAEILVRNLEAFGDEGLRYLETQIPLVNFRTPEGAPLTPEEGLEVYRARLARPDARATGVTVRFQLSVLRFHPRAEDALRAAWAIAAAHDDVVAVNLVGREDDDRGHPLRFLDTVRELRRTHGRVRLSIHAGEVDEPNAHVRDTLLLGAERIGHGLNLITDPDTMLLMRRGPWLVEINLISNLLLEYVDDYAEHPFPEYLRFGIPVALSTDDRGMWDSTLTDEYFVAVREFDLTWEELRTLSRNSLAHAFLEEDVKARLLAELDAETEAFQRAFRRGGLDAVARGTPQYRGFLCRRYEVCAPSAD